MEVVGNDESPLSGLGPVRSSRFQVGTDGEVALTSDGDGDVGHKDSVLKRYSCTVDCLQRPGKTRVESIVGEIVRKETEVPTDRTECRDSEVYRDV